MMWCIENYLESDNNGRWTTYSIKQKVATSGGKVATSGGKVATSGGKVDTSGRKVDTSGRKVDTSGRKVDTFCASSYYGKKLKYEELEKEILHICKNQYVKKEILAQMLGKSENYIRNKILPELLKAGKLKKRFPYTHNHPEQGYITTEEYAKEL